MNQELQNLQTAAGATFAPIYEDIHVPVSFGNDDAALAAATDAVALADRTHWGRILVTGADRLRYLHNQSTNNFQILQPGQTCDTVFVTATARTIDLATAYITPDSVLLLISPNRRHKIITWLDRYIFPADKVELQDITDTTATFSLIGPQATHLLTQLNLEPPPSNSHQEIDHQGTTIRLASGSGLATPGYTLITHIENAASLWQTLTTAGATPLGENLWEQLRIQQGRPVPDKELTEDYNPLEAGLWHTISFEKGCYIGQETIARLNTYKGVKVQLWGVNLPGPVTPGTPVTLGEEKIGTITSYTPTPTGHFALAYIRTKAGGVGLQVRIGDMDGETVEVPFLTRGYQ
ncbi:MAG: folate-binding protein YgfZ [Oscillatoriaceae cyanobacterium]